MRIFGYDFPSLNYQYKYYETCVKNIPTGNIIFYGNTPYELQGFTYDGYYVASLYYSPEIFIILDGWLKVGALLLDPPQCKDIYEYKQKDSCPF